MKTKINKKGTMALSQIMILLIGMIAISWAIGGGIGVVRAIDKEGMAKEEDIKEEPQPESICIHTQCSFICGAGGDSYYSACSNGDNKPGHCISTPSIFINKNCEGKGCTNGICNVQPNPSVNVPGQIISSAVPFGVNKVLENMFKKKTAEKFAEKGTEKIVEEAAKSKFAEFMASKTAAILGNAAIALGIFMITRWAASSLGATQAQANVLGAAAATAYFTSYILTSAKVGANLGVWGVVIGVGVGVVLGLILWKNEAYRAVSYECYAWDAELKGKNCEECNKQGILPCTEYQCRSLGQGCELVNKGLKNEMCVWVDKDVNPAIMKAWDDVLLEGYSYTPDNAISPPDRGVQIVSKNSQNDCIPAFTPLRFGIALENNNGEPKMARCKISYTRDDSFEDMPETFFTGGIKNYSHSITLSMPSAEALEAENITIEQGKLNELFVRCEDVNGNTNLGNFIFKFCVDDGPDTTPPLIVKTSWFPSEGGPIAYNISSEEMQIYVNELAECRWSHTNQAYETMEQQMLCGSSVLEVNAEMLYGCSTTLTGLKDRTENKFYFRCKDHPWETDENLRNTNEESFPFTLIGTQPLVIGSVKPNNTIIRDSADVVKVTFETETSAGYDEGKSSCYWSETGDDGDYIMFFNDEKLDKYYHTQDLWLSEGKHNYFIKCSDAAGNSDTAEINFTIETDRSAPIIVRAFREGTSYIKVITDEEAECVYSLDDCEFEFEDGIAMMTNDNLEHFEDWNTNLEYSIKCKDEYGNQPEPDQCNMVVRASDF